MATRHIFTGITSEGGLLPSDFLAALGDPKAEIEGLEPVAYGLAPGERLGDQVNRSWNRLKGCWVNFKRSIETKQPGEPTTTETRERFLLPLFQELDYGRLTLASAIEIDGKSYPVSHGWESVPIHLVGTHVDLDRRTPGAVGAAKTSPHSLVQQVLNSIEDHLWGIISNGFTLRLLRDNLTLTRMAFVEWDLQTIFDGDLYPEFFLLWLVCHQSRFEMPAGGRPDQCWAEKWKKQAEEKGLRALENLRPGVKKAIAALGAGLVSHKANQTLRSKLSSGELSTQDFYRQILRIVYRMLFLFVAEDRDLLHPPLPEDKADKKALESALKARNRYQGYYSISRLRDLTLYRAGTTHPDLWNVFILVSHWLGLDTGCPELALPPLGSFLWSPEATSDLNDSQVSNRHFLEAVHALAFIREGNVRRAVDYKNLGSEELGAVYEGLLELHPVVNADTGAFELETSAGHERKTSGSYYTPDSLVQCLLDSALEPVMEERLKEAQEMANSEWRMVKDPYREEFIDYASKRLSRPGSMATGPENIQGGLSSDQGVPKGGTVRDGIPNPAGSGFDTSQHSGGVGTTLSSGVHSVLAQCERQQDRIGDPSDFERGCRTVPGSGDSAHTTGTHHSGQTTSVIGTQPPKETELKALWEKTPFTIRHSLFAPTAILSMKVCDPAVGSGHFLIAAAHRMARRIAAARTGEEEPSPEATRSALRDVIGRCLYGVDVNPMSAELCKVSLWMEALEPGKPLSFLDHHIRVGNSLLGTTPELIAKGIPDEAFKPIEGDDKKACSALKKRNAAERKGIGGLFIAEDTGNQEALRRAAHVLESIDDDTPEAVHKKAETFDESQHSYAYVAAKHLADAWCTAFVIRKYFPPGFDPRFPSSEPFGLTQRHFNDLAKGLPLPSDFDLEVDRMASSYQFFHWHLAFPEVFGKNATNGELLIANSGKTPQSSPDHSPLTIHHPPSPRGFDVVLGNPPWERVKLQEKEWFAERSPEIANAPNAATRKRMIDDLKASDPSLYQNFLEDLRKAEGESHLMRNSGRYPLCGRGDINVYTIFAEGMRNLLNDRGRVGCVLPTGIATDDTTKYFFQDIIEKKSLATLYDFENKSVFPDIDSRMKFCLFTAGRGLYPTAERAEFVFFAHAVEDLRDTERRFTLSAGDIALLNPNTRTCPIFRSQKDAELTKAIYRHTPVLIREAQGTQMEDNPWGIKFSTMFHMANDSEHFVSINDFDESPCDNDGSKTIKDGKFVALYESKMFQIFDHRAADVVISKKATIRQGQPATIDFASHLNPFRYATPRYLVNLKTVDEFKGEYHLSWLIGIGLITSATNHRTLVSTLLGNVACGGSIVVVYVESEDTPILGTIIQASFSSIIIDFVVRQKLGGINLTNFIIKQLPHHSKSIFKDPESKKWLDTTLAFWIIKRVLELTYTAWDLEAFAKDCGYNGPPFRWDEERRFLLRCEIDAAFFHLYFPSAANGEWRIANRAEGAVRDETPEELKRHFPTPRDAVAYIMDTFPIVRRKDEEKYDGDYRTKRVILEIYDEMAEAMSTGIPYKTRLNPPPGPPEYELPEWKPGQPKPVNWPTHIHPPKGCES